MVPSASLQTPKRPDMRCYRRPSGKIQRTSLQVRVPMHCWRCPRCTGSRTGPDSLTRRSYQQTMRTHRRSSLRRCRRRGNAFTHPVGHLPHRASRWQQPCPQGSSRVHPSRERRRPGRPASTGCWHSEHQACPHRCGRRLPRVDGVRLVRREKCTKHEDEANHDRERIVTIGRRRRAGVGPRADSPARPCASRREAFSGEQRE